MTNNFSRRQFIAQAALVVVAAFRLSLAPARAADTNAVDPNTLAAGAAPSTSALKIKGVLLS